MRRQPSPSSCSPTRPRMAVWLGAVLVLTSGMVACDQETEPRTSSDGGRPRNVRPECTGAARLDDECRDRIRPPIALVYLEGTALVTEDLRGRSREFTDLTTEEVAASASGRHVAYVTGSPPTLNLFTPATDSRVPLGPGIDPVWSQTDNRLAWLQPTKPCEGETCVPEGKVVAQEIGVGEERVLLESGTWRILGWAGSSLHVADPSQPEQVLSVPGDGAGRPTEMSVPLAEYWGASPDGVWLLRIGNEGIEFVRLSPDGAASENRRVEPPYRLAEGAWAPDSSRVAAVLLGKESAVVTLSPRDPEPQVLSGSDGATGNVVWSADSSALAFVRTDPQEKGKLQAVLCELEAPRCRPLFSWRRGVRLLGFR